MRFFLMAHSHDVFDERDPFERTVETTPFGAV
jgi:hypothetical protein